MNRQCLQEKDNYPLSELENNRTRVLLVDDEENILKSLKRLLMDEELDLLTSTSGEQGLAVLRENPDIGLIVSDQRMPGLTGAEFLQKSREIAPDALRIMLTGYADINATIDAINKGGAYRYISKPWNDEELIQIIRDAVRQCRLISENKRLSALVKKQNEELKEWNSNLKNRVLEHTSSIRKRNDELRELNEKQKLNFENCLSAFSSLVELRDPETKNHSRNVARLSAMIAERMKLPAAEVEVIYVAALLHDIGKIGASDSLLHMDAMGINLNGIVEYTQHSIRGQAVINFIEDLQPAGVLIRHHHENFNGSGFPDGVRGEDIPLGSRIIAISDNFDRYFRKYRGDDSLVMALEAIKTNLEKKYDPALFSFLEQSVNEILTKIKEETEITEIEIQPSELREGMIIAREVRSGTGVLLICEGECLDAGKIQALTHYYQIDPPKQGVLVQFQDILRAAGAL
jgi:putative nucleotidyltransferase with HDIG domain